MGNLIFEPTEEQFGIFWQFIREPDVTDIDYNGDALWITDLQMGKYRAKEAETEITETFCHKIVSVPIF